MNDDLSSFEINDKHNQNPKSDCETQSSPSFKLATFFWSRNNL